MNVTMRAAASEDAPECGRICYEAFQAIGDAHSFPNYWRSTEVATTMYDRLIKHPAWHGVIAEREGKIIGSNFMDERAAIYGIGPTSVDPRVQDCAALLSRLPLQSPHFQAPMRLFKRSRPTMVRCIGFWASMSKTLSFKASTKPTLQQRLLMTATE
jgi:hypothetical protein